MTSYAGFWIGLGIAVAGFCLSVAVQRFAVAVLVLSQALKEAAGVVKPSKPEG